MKLAIITSHPIQYYAPWFRFLAQRPGLELRVFYLWDFGVRQQRDQQFSQSIQWDIPLLEGYDFEWVDNISSRPGTSHFWGLQNPSLSAQVAAFGADAVLLMNYNYASLYRFISTWTRSPLLFRGDSHRLVPDRGPKAWLKRQWISLIYGRFQALLYVGKGNYQYFQEHGVPEDRLFHCPHGIDNDRFMAQQVQAQADALCWKQALGIASEQRVILFAGKWIEKKRPLDLLRAFAEANLENVSLVFVGAGALAEPLQREAERIPGVYFAPFQNQSQMPRTYALADLVVLPSYGSGETWGLAINEAMAMGRAVLVSDHVGCAADLVCSGENGLVFRAGDRSSLVAALRMAFEEPDRLRLWGEAGLRRIQGFSYGQMTAGLERALVSLSKIL